VELEVLVQEQELVGLEVSEGLVGLEELVVLVQEQGLVE
jgi:hypothetical protein